MNRIELRDDTHWHELRAKNIGSSEAAALFNEQPAYAMSHYHLFQVKAGNIPPPEVENERTKWGIRLEGVVGEAIAEERAWTVKRLKGIYIKHPTVKGMGCSIDFEIVAGEEAQKRDGPGILECKNVAWDVWKRSWTQDEPPVHTIIQLQFQLACTGYKWGAIGGLVGGNHPECFIYDARPKMIKALEKEVAQFWADIKAGKEPTPDSTTSTSEALKALYPEAVPEKAIDMSESDDFPNIVASLKQGMLDKNAAQAQVKAAENRLYGMIGDAEIAMSDGQEILTAKTHRRKGYAVNPTTYRTIKLKEFV